MFEKMNEKHTDLQTEQQLPAPSSNRNPVRTDTIFSCRSIYREDDSPFIFDSPSADSAYHGVADDVANEETFSANTERISLQHLSHNEINEAEVAQQQKPASHGGFTDEDKKRISESVLGKYGYGDTILIVFGNTPINVEYRGETIRMVKEGQIPLNQETISDLNLSQKEVEEIEAAQQQQKPASHRGFTDEDKKRISESVLGKYGYGDTIPIVFGNTPINVEYRDETIRMIKEGQIPLNLETINDLNLSREEVEEIETVLDQWKREERSDSQSGSLTLHSGRKFELGMYRGKMRADDEPQKPESAFSMAHKFISKNKVLYYQGEIFIYDFRNLNCYIQVDEEYLRKLVFRDLRKTIEERGNPNLVDSIVQAVILVLDSESADCEASHDRLTFIDGQLNLQTGQLEPYNPEFFMTYRIEASYRQGAYTATPHFDQMLYVMSEGDPEWQQRLKEFIGYLLAPLGERKKLILLQGVTSSGKTTLVNFINGVLSPGSVYVLDVENFSGQFSLSNLPFKAICEIQDMPDRSISASVVSKIKQLTGHDMISTDVKYESRRQFVNTAKLVFATNHAFFTKDGDAALKDRIAVIPFLRSLSNEERIPDLTERLLLERDGIIYKCLNAYLALPYSSEFTGAGKPQYEVNYAVGFDSTDIDAAVMTFITSYFVPSPDGSVFIEDAYNLFCSKVLPVSLQDFSVRFKRYAESSMSVTHTRKRKPGQKNPQSCLEGIAFKQ